MTVCIVLWLLSFFHQVFKCKQLNSDAEYLIDMAFNCYDERTYITATYIHLKQNLKKTQ